MDSFGALLKAHMSIANQASSLITDMHRDFMALARQYMMSGNVEDAEIELDSEDEPNGEEFFYPKKAQGLMNDYEDHYPYDEYAVGESRYFVEDEIDLNDPALASGKSFGLPKDVSVWGTPRGEPDTQIPLPSLRQPKVGMPIQLSINFTNRGPEVNRLLGDDSGMFVEGYNPRLDK